MSVEREYRQFLDLWDAIAFESPEAGRRHADQGLELVRQLCNPPPALLARAFAICGSSFRAVSELARAEECFQEARKLYENIAILLRQDNLDKADLYRRMVFLRLEQRCFDEALELAHHAATILSVAGASHELGRVYAAKGLAQLKLGDPGAIDTLCLALGKLDAGQNPNAYHAACHNLLMALGELRPKPELLEAALAQLCKARLTKRSRRPARRQAHRLRLTGYRRKTMPDAKARFLQGRILNLLGQHEEARKLLESAREDLITLGMPLAVAEVSIELAECYLWFSESRRWPRIERLAREALELLRPVPDAPEVVAACQLLLHVAAARPARGARQELERCRARLYKLG